MEKVRFIAKDYHAGRQMASANDEKNKIALNNHRMAKSNKNISFRRRRTIKEFSRSRGKEREGSKRLRT